METDWTEVIQDFVPQFEDHCFLKPLKSLELRTKSFMVCLGAQYSSLCFYTGCSLDLMTFPAKATLSMLSPFAKPDKQLNGSSIIGSPKETMKIQINTTRA